MKKEYFFAILSLLLFLYCLLRAAGLSMTHDESSTVLNYTYLTFRNIVSNQPPSANNHILNTLLVKMLTGIANDKVLIRLPNLLAGALYLFFACRLLQRLAPGFREQLLGFALLALNQYMLEFFSLGRGYGLSLGFMMGSLYYAQRFREEGQLRPLAWSAGFCILACYSNMVMLNYFVALAGAVNLHLLLPFRSIGWKAWRRANAVLMAAALILAGLLYGPIRAMLQEGAFYYGGSRGILEDTFTSLMQNYLGPRNYFGESTRELILFPVYILLILGVSRNVMRGIEEKRFTAAAFFTSIFLLMALSNYVQFEWMGTKYLIQRTALLYFPAMALVIFFLFRGSPSWAGLALALIIGLHFLDRANVKFTQEWWFDQHAEEVFEYLAEKEGKEDKFVVGTQWMFGATLEYYRVSRGYDRIMELKWEREMSGSKEFDYYYLNSADAPRLHPDYVLEKDYGGYYLMRLPPEKKETQ